MAKKVVATLQTGSGKNHTKVIKMVKSPKTGAYTFTNDVGVQTWAQAQNLVAGRTYYFAVTAYSTEGLESDFSEEISYTPLNQAPVLTSIP